MYSFVVLQILDAVLIVDNMDDFCDNIFLTVGVFVVSYKLLYYVINQETYETLIGVLNKEPFLPTNEEENEIQARFDRFSE